MELDFSQMALEVSHHGCLLVTHLTTQEHCCHTSFHAYWYMNVMRSSRLFRVSLFLENGSILMIWGCFSIVSNVIRSNYCCRRHTMHGNRVFSGDSIFYPTTKRMFMCVQRLHVQVFESTCVYGVLRVHQVYELVWYELSPLHSSKWPHHSPHRILAAQTTSISANKWLEKYSFSSKFSTPTRYHNPIYDLVGFASGIFDRYLRCPLEDIYFMWTFYFLFLLLTAVRTFPPRWEVFPPRWKHSHRGENKYFSPRWECSHRGENVLTAVRMFPPQWKYFSPRWKYFSPRWKYFSPRWECSHRGGNVSTSVEILLTTVGMFSPRWECSHRGF